MLKNSYHWNFEKSELLLVFVVHIVIAVLLLISGSFGYNAVSGGSRVRPWGP